LCDVVGDKEDQGKKMTTGINAYVCAKYRKAAARGIQDAPRMP
jgi:hypothetical protein